MKTSEARILANQKNAAKSTGPKTVEGKEQSRRNALKHGLTGAGIVLLEGDADELKRRSAAFASELRAKSPIEVALAHRAALSSIRMERGADQSTAALTEHVLKSEQEFVLPEGIDQQEADRLRTEFARRSMFDPSKEAVLARRYEAAAERGFYRALKELRQHQASVKMIAEVELHTRTNNEIKSGMASFLATRAEDAEMEQIFAEMGMPPMPADPGFADFARMGRSMDLPFAVGKPR